METLILSLPVSTRHLIARHCGLVLAVSLAAVAGCGPTSSRSVAAVPAREDVTQVAPQSGGTDLADKGDTSCGNPIRFPVTAACVRASEDGTVLQTESDIVMEIWRSCQMMSAKGTERLLRQTGVGVGSLFGVRAIYDATQQEQADRAAGIPPEPCGVVWENSAACAQSSPACQAEMDSDYSCHALRSDPFELAQKACHKKVLSEPPCVRMQKLREGSRERQKASDGCMAIFAACDPRPRGACEAAKAKLARFRQVEAEWARQQLEEQDKLMLNSQPTYPPQPRHTDCFSNGRFTNCDSY